MPNVLTVLPNVEALVSDFLRAQPEMAALVGDRGYTSIPKGAVYPLFRVTQITDGKLTSEPLWITETVMQVEGYGGSKAQASAIARLAEGLLAARIVGTYAEHNAVVNGFTGGGMQDIPDDEYEPAKPRFLFVCTIVLHPIEPLSEAIIPPPAGGDLDGGGPGDVPDNVVDGGAPNNGPPTTIYDGGTP